MKNLIRTLALAAAFAAPALMAAPAHAASQDAMGPYRGQVYHGEAYGGRHFYRTAYHHNHHRYEHRSVRRVCHHGHCRRIVRYW